MWGMGRVGLEVIWGMGRVRLGVMWIWVRWGRGNVGYG